MRRQIRKQAPVFVAVIFLVAAALGIGGFILSNQRFYLPAWVPLIGTDFYEVEAQLSTAQAVVPGQGQTVNVAGVKVGEVGEVTLEDGTAVVKMQIRDEYRPIYRDASILLRPKTGLKDMILSLDPGTPGAGRVEEGGRVPVSNTLPDVNADEVLGSLDADTRAYLRILLNDGGRALADDGGEVGQGAPQDLRETFKRFEPSARDAKRLTGLLAERRRNIRRAIHSFQQLSTELGSKDEQLASLVDGANANFEAFAQEEASLREALQLFPGALAQTATTLRDVEVLAAELGPTLEGLRPFARELAPALRAQRPFFRETTPILRDQLRPFARDAQPAVRDLRAATDELAPVTPRLTKSFKVLNSFFNTLAYDPPGAARNSYLWWSGWAGHDGSLLTTAQDAHGAMVRGVVLLPCTDYSTLESITLANAQLGMLTRLANFPPEQGRCSPITNPPPYLYDQPLTQPGQAPPVPGATP